MTPNLPQGVWSFPSGLDPNELEYMVVDPAASRIVTFFVISINPVKRNVMRNWYEQVEPGLLRSRLSPASAWSLVPYMIDGPKIHWTNLKPQKPWTWVPPEIVPEWIPENVLKAYAKMDLLQKETDRASTE